MCIGLNIDIAMALYAVSKILEQQISKPRSHSPVIFVRDSTAKKSRRVHWDMMGVVHEALVVKHASHLLMDCRLDPMYSGAPTSSFHTFISSVFTS